MPRAYRHRRQEIRKRRRQARRSLNQLVLDDDLDPSEEDAAEPPLYELAPRRHGRDPLHSPAPGAHQDH